MRYVSMGRLPAKRHTQFRENGTLLSEEVMGYEGFSGNESILYHLHSPCRVAEVGDFEPIELEEWVPDAHVHRLTDTVPLAPEGDPIFGRKVLMFNTDVEMGICKPTHDADCFYRNGEGDEVLFVHEGSGELETVFGRLPFGAHDQLVVAALRVRLELRRRMEVALRERRGLGELPVAVAVAVGRLDLARRVEAHPELLHARVGLEAVGRPARDHDVFVRMEREPAEDRLELARALVDE